MILKFNLINFITLFSYGVCLGGGVEEESFFSQFDGRVLHCSTTTFIGDGGVKRTIIFKYFGLHGKFFKEIKYYQNDYPLKESELPDISEPQLFETYFFFVDRGSIVCFDLNTSSIVWRLKDNLFIQLKTYYVSSEGVFVLDGKKLIQYSLKTGARLKDLNTNFFNDEAEYNRVSSHGSRMLLRRSNLSIRSIKEYLYQFCVFDLLTNQEVIRFNAEAAFFNREGFLSIPRNDSLVLFDPESKQIKQRRFVDALRGQHLFGLHEFKNGNTLLLFERNGRNINNKIINRNGISIGAIDGQSFKNEHSFAKWTYIGCRNDSILIGTESPLEVHCKSMGDFVDFDDVTPPKIAFTNPVVKNNEAETFDQTIFISGRVTDSSKVVDVTINGQNLPFLPSGEFSGVQTLELGQNRLQIAARDAYGNSATESISITRKEGGLRGASVVLENKPEGQYENYRSVALLIAVQRYVDENVRDLLFPENDTKALRDVLVNEYNFKAENITLLIDPTRNNIIKTFDSLLNKLTDRDNLLIFYAGHGEFDMKLKQGYWLPSDANATNKGTWVSNSDIRDYIGGISTNHTLLISDACFSGSIFEFTRSARIDNSIARVMSKKARIAITSGLDNPVPDKSVFLNYLLKALRENRKPVLRANELFTSFQSAVLANTENIPQYGVVKNAQHEGGDFLFIRKSSPSKK